MTTTSSQSQQGSSLWETFQSLNIDSFGLDGTPHGEDPLPSHLDLIEKALAEAQEQLVFGLEAHQHATEDAPCVTVSASSPSSVSGMDPVTILSQHLALGEYEEALARFLEYSSTYWYTEGPGNEALKGIRQSLWLHYEHLWDKYAMDEAFLSSSSALVNTPVSPSAATAAGSAAAVAAAAPSLTTSLPMHVLASLGLLTSKEALEVFIGYKLRVIRTKLELSLNENTAANNNDGDDSGLDASMSLTSYGSSTINMTGTMGSMASTSSATTTVVKTSPSNAEILIAVREIDVVQSIVLAELRADASLLTTRAFASAAETASPCFSLPFDSDAVVEVVENAYMKVLHERIGGALARISLAGLRASGTDDGAGAPKGLPMFLYDHEDGEVEVPYLGEEILVMKWDDGRHAAREGGAIRWWLATVIESPEYRLSLARRRSSGSLNHQGPILLLKESGEKIYLRGSFFVRPRVGPGATGGQGGGDNSNTSAAMNMATPSSPSASNVDASTTAATLNALGGGGGGPTSPLGAGCNRLYSVGQRVLMQDEGGKGFYSEGVVVKIQSGGRGGTRYCVRLDGATAGNFVLGNILLPGPARVKIWHIWSAMLRAIHDLPIKVQEALVGPTGLCPLTVGGGGGPTAPPPPHPSQSTTSPRTSSVSTTTPRDSNGAVGTAATAAPWLEPLNFGLLLLDQGLGTRLAKTWVKPLADHIHDIHHYLLVYMSRIFAGQKLLGKVTDVGSGGGGGGGVAGGGGMGAAHATSGGVGSSTAAGGPGYPSSSSTSTTTGGRKSSPLAHFQSQKALKILRPFLADLSHLLTLCVVGCSCIDTATLEAGGFGGREGSGGAAEQVAMTMLRGGGGRDGGHDYSTTGGGGGNLTSRMESVGLDGRTTTRGGSGGGGDDDDLQKLTGAFWSVIKAMSLEIKHFYQNLRYQFILPSILYTSDMPHCAEVLILVVYLREAWKHIMHRLDLTMSRFQLDENLATTFSGMVWRMSATLDEMVSSLQARVINLNLHWCKVYLLQDISVQDWQSPQAFMQDRRCTYGVLAWSLFMRGLFFDFRSALLNSSSAPETREIISAILAGSLPALTTRYLAINPSRARLSQYISDVACILVTSLTLSLLLSDDGACSLRQLSSSSTSSLFNATTNTNTNPSDASSSKSNQQQYGRISQGFREVLPIQSTPLEAGLRPHDAAHQATMVNLIVVEKHCEVLMVLLCLLLAPAEVMVKYLRTESRQEIDAQRGRRSSLVGSSGSFSGGGIYRGGTSSEGGGERGGNGPVSPGGGGPGSPRLPYNRLDDFILNIDITRIAESLAASLELSDVFNVIGESHKLGADRSGGGGGGGGGGDGGAGEDGSTATTGGRRGSLSPGGRRSTSDNTPYSLFAEYYVSKAGLADIELHWNEVLTHLKPLDHRFIPTLLLRRYEMNDLSTYPPLTEEERADRQHLYDALQAHELYQDLMVNMEEVMRTSASGSKGGLGGGGGQQECTPS